MARLLLTRPTTMTPSARLPPASFARRVSRASLAWACVLTFVACIERPGPPAREPAEVGAPSATAPPSQASHDASSEAQVVAPPPGPTSPCEALTIDAYGVRQSSRRIYLAARRYFLAHTGPGSRHALGPDLVRERPSLRFGNANGRETGAVMQATVDQIATTYPGSLVFPTRRRPRLRTDRCYDEVYLDLTEDGRYLVIVETDTARPVFMYWQQYRP